MGRSAKLMKRPTKAEKVARSINTPATSRRERSLSPEEGPRSEIPLFNTSAKRSKPSRPPPVDSAGDQPMVASTSASAPSSSEAGKGKKKTLKDKLARAKEAVRAEEERSTAKLGGAGKPSKGKKGVLGGVDYLKLHESRPGGAFRKKLR